MLQPLEVLALFGALIIIGIAAFFISKPLSEHLIAKKKMPPFWECCFRHRYKFERVTGKTILALHIVSLVSSLVYFISGVHITAITVTLVICFPLVLGAMFVVLICDRLDMYL